MEPRKVAVVGMGGIFPRCDSVEDFGDKIFSNQSLIRHWDQAAAFGKQVRSTVSGYVSPEEAGLRVEYSTNKENYPELYVDTLHRIPLENLATADIGSVWAMLSTQNAIQQSGWSEEEIQSPETGVVIGSGGGGHEVLRHAWNTFFIDGKKSRLIGSHSVDRGMVYRDAANVACLIKSQGICEGVGSACACGISNIGYAYRMIKYGVQDRMIAGGTESTSIETFIGFDAMSILSRGYEPELSSRPFDKGRNGFVCSFGCAVVALEELEVAKARGANILAVIDGYFNNSNGVGDMFAPSFDGQQRLWNGLRKEVPDLNPDVVKVHGTSTPRGDSIELFSVIKAVGQQGYHISAPKSQFGHMLGAAGAVEFLVMVLMLQRQQVAPCLNSNDLNEELEDIQQMADWQGSSKPIAAYRDLLPQQSFPKDIRQIVGLNYGFGGTNGVISISNHE